MAQRPPKKSEWIEIRIPHPTKQAFMARCQAQGVSASESLRRYIEAQLAPPAKPRLRYVAAAGLVAAALAAVAAPSIARPAGSGSSADFDRLDADHDGRLTLGEFTGSAGRTARP